MPLHAVAIWRLFAPTRARPRAGLGLPTFTWQAASVHVAACALVKPFVHSATAVQ